MNDTTNIRSQAGEINSQGRIKCYSNSGMLGDFWPGIQLYYPPVKYSPAQGIYEDLAQASARMCILSWMAAG